MDQATNPRKQSLSIRRAIRHGLLGKESLLDECHYAGSDAYWDEAMEAQLGWPHGQVQRRPADDRRADEARARAAGELHYEPVYGMTSRQLHEWLTRNAQLKPTRANYAGFAPGLIAFAPHPAVKFREAEIRSRAAFPLGNGAAQSKSVPQNQS